MPVLGFSLALRWIRRHAWVWGLAVVSLSLGIFANVSLLGLITPMFHSQESGQVHVVWCLVGDEHQGFSDAEFLYFQQNSTVGEGLAARVLRMQSVAANGPSEIRPIAEVSSNYFRVLRHEPLLGSAFMPGTDSPGSGRSVVLEEGYWTSRFGRSASIVDQNLEINQQAHHIVGVYRSTSLLDSGVSGWSVAKYRRERTDGDHVPLVRLDNGNAVAVEAELTSLHREYVRQIGRRDKCHKILVDPLRDAVLDGHFRELPPVRPRLLYLLAILLFVLTLAVVNFTSLGLARAHARVHEVSIRRALGATNLRLAVQFFVEGLFVTIPSCVLGIGLAYAIHPQAIKLISNLTGVVEAQFSWSAAFSWGVILGLACAFFGTLPSSVAAIRRGMELVPGRENLGGRLSPPGRLGASRIFIAGQCGMAYALLVLAILTVFSVRQLGIDKLGFETEGLLVAKLRMPLEGYVTRVAYEGERRFEVLPDLARFAREVSSKLQGLPGVSVVGLMQRFDVERSFEYFRLPGQGPFTREEALGYEAPGSQSAALHPVNPQFFRSLGVRLLQGRFFTEDDGASGRHVSVISESMAKRYWPARSPIGQRLQVVHASVENFQDLPFSEIVGVIEDLQFNLEASNRRRAIFIPYSQLPTGPQMLLVERVYLTLLLRHESSSDVLAGPVRGIIGGRDRSVTLESLEDVKQVLRAPYTTTFLFSPVMVALASAGIILAIIGVYGITAFTVLRRGTEFCIRRALGATQQAVLRNAVSVNLKTGIVGLTLGLVLTIFLARTLTQLLPGFLGMSFGVAALAAILLLGSLMLASLIPALRTYRLNPASLLRMDSRSNG